MHRWVRKQCHELIKTVSRLLTESYESKSRAPNSHLSSFSHRKDIAWRSQHEYQSQVETFSRTVRNCFPIIHHPSFQGIQTFNYRALQSRILSSHPACSLILDIEDRTSRFVAWWRCPYEDRNFIQVGLKWDQPPFEKLVLGLRGTGKEPMSFKVLADHNFQRSM